MLHNMIRLRKKSRVTSTKTLMLTALVSVNELIVLLCYITLCKYETQSRHACACACAWEVPEMPD